MIYQKPKRKRREKGQVYGSSESEDDKEQTDQNDHGYQSYNHFDSSNHDSRSSGDERDDKVEQEAENAYQEEEHENVTPETANESPNPPNDGNCDEYPDSNKNPSNSTEDEPSSDSRITGTIQVLSHPKPSQRMAQLIKAIRKVLTTLIRTLMITPDHMETKGVTRTPQVGKNRLGFAPNKLMGLG